MDKALQCYYLHQLGIEPWTLREKANHGQALRQLEKIVHSCVKCELHKTRTHAVFARGNLEAKLMIVGEAPGYHEDKQGQPFVGKAGMLLNKMLQSVGLSPEEVYIANVLKCRPPSNRDPSVDEISACESYLKEQIALVNPCVILGVGKFAGQFLTNTKLPLNKMRQQVHEYGGISVFISFHPAYLLRNPLDKKKAYLDLLSVKQLLKKFAC
ncbi:uracil-DNA glycosylase [Legionella impletisoli]|uniref:Type-4 uracil-DNA glycosylase n=1 Tax=Legionella impletisoli TaxID=343510 RepID=A0A917N8H5_9GAMM|nr:uracil-DNA glycosylase [Legionella impletisoli]GGI77822.1 uracil-DNA glycosylase [Legionella impletisoli]